jgi:outer membrane protein assembly factor BamE (lipoprotein component of BamABCDE complex)
MKKIGSILAFRHLELVEGSVRSFCRTAIAVGVIIMLTACSRLTEDNLQKIHNGMTTDDVKAILGEPTSSETGSALGLVSGTTYVYHTDKSDVKITFVNDKVIATEGNFQ